MSQTFTSVTGCLLGSAASLTTKTKSHRDICIKVIRNKDRLAPDADYDVMISVGYVYGNQMTVKIGNSLSTVALFCKNDFDIGYFETYIVYSQNHKVVLGQTFEKVASPSGSDVHIFFLGYMDV